MYAWDRTGRASRVMPMSSGQQRRSGCSAPLARLSTVLLQAGSRLGNPTPTLVGHRLCRTTSQSCVATRTTCNVVARRRILSIQSRVRLPRPSSSGLPEPDRVRNGIISSQPRATCAEVAGSSTIACQSTAKIAVSVVERSVLIICLVMSVRLTTSIDLDGVTAN